MVRSKLWLSLILGASAIAVHADTVYLSDGTEISGTIVEDNSNVVVVRRASGTVQSFRKNNVDAVVYDTAQKTLSKVGGTPVDPAAAQAAKLAPPTPSTPANPAAPATPAAPGPLAQKPVEPPKTPNTAVAPDKPIGQKPPAPSTRQGVANVGQQPEAPLTPALPPASPTAPVKPTDTATAPPAPTNAKPDAKAGDTKPVDNKTVEAPKPADSKTAEATKPADGSKTAATDPKSTDPKKEPEWTAPPGLAGFPDKAPRMKPDQEAAFMQVMNSLSTPNPDARAAGKAQMLAFGPDVLPYAIAAAQHTNVETRATAMDVIGQLPNGASATKCVIEMMYSALPDTGSPASYQVPYLRSGKSTLHAVTGQSFINVEPSSALIQTGMKLAIDWYNANMDRLPKQITDPKLDETDPQYVAKLRKARALVLVRREWPRPPLSADIVNRDPVGNRTNLTAKDVISTTDKNLTKLPVTNNYDTRAKDTQRAVDPRDAALNRK